MSVEREHHRTGVDLRLCARKTASHKLVSNIPHYIGVINSFVNTSLHKIPNKETNQSKGIAIYYFCFNTRTAHSDWLI